VTFPSPPAADEDDGPTEPWLTPAEWACLGLMVAGCVAGLVWW